MIDNNKEKRLIDKAKKIRNSVLKMMKPPKEGHLGGSMSCADIITVLYYYKIKHDPKNPKWAERDRVILSKGHSCLSQYAVLADLNYFPYNDIYKIKEISSHLQGHPDVNKTIGIEANTGSLGQGLSIGIGMCLGARIDNYNYNVYVVIGDGELQEGQIWEAAMAAAHYKLNNIVAIIDNNKLQATGFIKERMDLGDVAGKWKAFGWEVIEINGHSILEIANALDAADDIKCPVCLIAHTVKGKGVNCAENIPGYHKVRLSEENYFESIKNLSQ